jgi:hypothetical protein
VPPSPTWCVCNKFSVFNALETWFYRKLVVLRNLEARFLKTRNLRGPIYEIVPGTTLRGDAEKKAFQRQGSACGEIIRKGW